MLKTLYSAAADLVVVAIFVVVGTLSHEMSLTVATCLRVAWPFIAGLAMGWVAVQAWRNPTRLWPTGIFTAAITIVGAMTLRALTGQGTELGFIVVSTGVLSVGMLGWRALLESIRARRAAPSASDLEIIAAVQKRAGSHER